MALEPYIRIDQLDVCNLSADTLVMDGEIDMGGNRITNLGAPVAGTDAATKTYVDTSGGGGGGAPGGADTQVQYNAAGAFGGDADFTWRAGSKALAVSGAGARLAVGSQALEAGAALQLKTDVGAGSVPVGVGPARLYYQSAASGDGDADDLMRLALSGQTAAYCELVITAVTTTSPAGDLTVERRRFLVSRDIGGVALGPVTVDYSVPGSTGLTFATAVDGSDLVVSATGGSNDSYDYTCTARLDVTGTWPLA